MPEELWDSARVGSELGGLTPGSARKAMKRAGIKEVRGYPSYLVRRLIALRKNTPPKEK